MKLFKLKDKVTVILEDGTKLQKSNCSISDYERITLAVKNDDIDEIYDIMTPTLKDKVAMHEFSKSIFDKVGSSKYMEVKGQSIYIPSICELSVPQDIVEVLIEAEMNEDEDTVQTILNFWTLASQNPDSRARNNMFWFLKKYGLTISKSGLFVAYRNAVVKNEGTVYNLELSKRISESYFAVRKFNSGFKKKLRSPSDWAVYEVERDYSTMEYETHPDTEYDDELDDIIANIEEDGSHVTDIVKVGNLEELYRNLSSEDDSTTTTYTDAYTRTMNIKIGEPVIMERSKCDANQDNTCSRGLHVAGRSWLQRNYFGDVGLMVLVNPADVVAVPPLDSYGKMRTCAYYPIKIVEWDENGEIIEEAVPHGFEDDFMERILYTGAVNEKDDAGYEFVIPALPEINRDVVIGNLEEIKNKIKNKLR